MENILRLKTHRGALKFLFLGIATCGIYDIIVMEHVSTDLNILAGRHDGKKTMEFTLAAVLMILTLLVGYPVWYTRLCRRIHEQLELRNIHYKFGVGTFWGWGIVGFLFGFGPIIFLHKLFKAMNKLCDSYNQYGE